MRNIWYVRELNQLFDYKTQVLLPSDHKKTNKQQKFSCVFLFRRTRCILSKKKLQERLKGEQYQFSGSILFFHFNF